MIRFKNIRVRSFALDYFDITWELVPHNEDVQRWRFHVERSENDLDGFEDISGPLTDQYWLRDNVLYQLNPLRTWNYRIRAVRDDSEEVFSEATTSEGPTDLLAAEVTRNLTVMWREYSGTAHWIFQRRTFGQRCPSCWSDRLGTVTQPQCEVCWGTGFSGGYHRPIKVWGQSQEGPHMIQQQQHMELAPISGQLVCPPLPEIRPGDLIVDSKNRRYLAMQEGGSRRLGVRVTQRIQLSAIERSQIEFKVPLNVDHQVEELQGARNFTNPHNLEDLEADVGFADILRSL